MASSQCFLLPKVGVEGKLSPKIVNQATAFLLTPPCLAFPNAQSSLGLKLLLTWMSIALVVAWVTEFNMEVIDIFLARGRSWLHLLVTCFLEKLNCGYPVIMCFDLAIKNDSLSVYLTMIPFSSVNLSDISTMLAFFCSWFVPRASLNQLIDVNDIE